MFLASMKLSVYQSIPLLFMSLAHHDQSVARRGAIKILAQWNCSKELACHHVLTLDFMQDEGGFFKDLLDFIGGKARELCILLDGECDWLLFCRMNELSVERLHRVGTMLVNHAARHIVVFLSFGLRSGEMQDGNVSKEDFEFWAECCHKLRNTSVLVKTFQFNKHPAILESRDKLLAGGAKPKELMVSHKTIRECFYRGDLPTLFDEYGGLSQAIQQATNDWKQSVEQKKVDPLAAAKDIHADEDLKVQGFAMAYAVKHFQEVVEEDALYTLPPGKSETIDDVFQSADVTRAEIDKMSETGLVDDSAFCFDEPLPSAPSSETTLEVSRVLSFNPSGAKLLPTVLQRARGDHIAVASYRIDAVEVVEPGCEPKLKVTSGLCRDPNIPTKLISLNTFMNFEPVALLKGFLKCNVTGVQEYTFEGKSLPSECFCDAALAVLKNLMQADAYPGPFGLYAPPTFRHAQEMPYLKLFKDHGLVKFLPDLHCRFQITLEGLKHLRSHTVCESYQRVLEVRPNVAIADRTHWELLQQLGNEDWKASPMPAGKPPASVRAKGKLKDSEKVYFFTRNKLDISHAYLLCLAQRDVLASKGLMDSICACLI